jgi:Glycosyltransferase family 87
LFFVTLALALAPARLTNLPWPGALLYNTAQVTAWLALLVFLTWTAGRPIRETWSGQLVPALSRAWERYGVQAQWLTVAFMAIAAAGRLAKGFYRLIWDQRDSGAVDLIGLYAQAQTWVARGAMFTTRHWVYPPASYPLAWLSFGWLTVPAARWWWALTTVAMLVVLALLALRATGVQAPRERLFWIVMVPALAATGVTIGNGQLSLHCLAASLAGLLLIVRRKSWPADLAGATLLSYALIKPTISAPFVILALAVARRLRPALLIGAGYGGLTWLAAWHLQRGPVELFSTWVVNLVSAGRFVRWLHLLGYDEWLLPIALLALATFGLWAVAFRRADIWALAGVAAMVARLSTYHRVYDDLLVFVPLVAVYRLVRAAPGPAQRNVAAGLLFVAALALALAPARLVELPAPVRLPYDVGRSISWVALLLFLAWSARKRPAPLEEITGT